ncbi:hypothetical protein EAF00_006016 [Botryotinia globosa]|nr:hypothetical protein EAF00_006016 [Botryotinia globosa]
MQELERAAILGATARPRNSVTLIHRAYVPPALVNRIKNVEQFNKALKNRVLGHENIIAKLNQQNQKAVIQSYDGARKSQRISSEACKIRKSIQLPEDRLKIQEDFSIKKLSTCIQSIGLDLKSQKSKIENQERELDEKSALYQSILMESQERELGEKLASYEENLLQKVKKIILAELLGSETPRGNIGGKHEPRIVCSPQYLWI